MPREARAADLGLAGPDRQPLLGLGAARPGGHPARAAAAARLVRHRCSPWVPASAPSWCWCAPPRPPGAGRGDRPGRLHGPGRRWSALERLAELVVSTRNAAWSFERGGVESGQRPLPGHGACCTPACWSRCWSRPGSGAPTSPPLLAWSMLALVLASQALRWWCIATLGRRWNTRVIVVPGLAPVAVGPLPAAAAPQLRRGRGRGRRAAAGARGVDHRAGLHASPTPPCSPCGSGSRTPPCRTPARPRLADA